MTGAPPGAIAAPRWVRPAGLAKVPPPRPGLEPRRRPTSRPGPGQPASRPVPGRPASRSVRRLAAPQRPAPRAGPDQTQAERLPDQRPLPAAARDLAQGAIRARSAAMTRSSPRSPRRAALLGRVVAGATRQRRPSSAAPARPTAPPPRARTKRPAPPPVEDVTGAVEDVTGAPPGALADPPWARPTGRAQGPSAGVVARRSNGPLRAGVHPSKGPLRAAAEQPHRARARRPRDPSVLPPVQAVLPSPPLLLRERARRPTRSFARSVRRPRGSAWAASSLPMTFRPEPRAPALRQAHCEARKTRAERRGRHGGANGGGGPRAPGGRWVRRPSRRP